MEVMREFVHWHWIGYLILFIIEYLGSRHDVLNRIYDGLLALYVKTFKRNDARFDYTPRHPKKTP